jgi:trigger factor
MLRERIANHMKLEKERKQREKDEIDFFDELIKTSSFEKIPEQMIDHELDKMVHELKMMLSQNGLAWNDFLSQENKKEEDIKKGFVPQAEKRAKVFLIIKEIANAEKISITEEEIKNKINKDREAYQATLLRIKNDGSKEATEAKKEIEQFLSMSNTEEYFRYLENAMRTDAVMEWIGKELLGW